MTDEETPKPKGTDYTSPKKGKPDSDAPKMEIKKVVTGPVVMKKQGVGDKVKNLFIAADFKSVTSYVTYEIIIPAIKNMVVDGFQRGAERAVYGESRFRRPPIVGGSVSRYSYQTPPNRERVESYRDPRTNPPTQGTSYPRAGRPDFLLQTKEEADAVIEEMYNIFGVYEYVTVGQLKELVGLQATHTDEIWGWLDLRGTTTKQDRAGFWLDLPNPVPLN